jgi:multidrug resistance efflux pump
MTPNKTKNVSPDGVSYLLGKVETSSPGYSGSKVAPEPELRTMIWKLVFLSGGLLAALAGTLGFCLFGHGSAVLEIPGTVEIQEVRLGSRTGGRVARLAVTEGQWIEPGQVLVHLEAPELQAQHSHWLARMAAAEAELAKARFGPREEEKEAARAAVASARARLQRLEAGYRPEEIAQARGEVQSAEAELDHANKEVARERRVGSWASSAAQKDAVRATFERAQGQMNTARARLQMLLAGTRTEEIAEAEAEQKRAEANCRLLEVGTRVEDIALAEARVKELRAKVRELEVQLAELAIRAPERVVVEVLAVRPGDILSPNQPAVRVLRAGDLWVRGYVSEVDLGKVRLNQAALVMVDSHPGKRFSGQVVEIASVSEFTPRNVQSVDERHHQVFGVKIHVADTEGILKSGMAAKIALPVQK